MHSAWRLLVVEENADNGGLLVRSLSRKFPQALVQLCREGELAKELLRNESFDAVVVHRTHDMDALTAIKAFRAVRPDLPILAVSTVDRSTPSIAAGADGFMRYDEWLRIGAVVQEIIEAKRGGTRSPMPVQGATPPVIAP